MRIRENTLRDALHSDDPAERIRAVQLACRDQRQDLLADLIALLPDESVGYFVEECLPQFGEVVSDPLRRILRDQTASYLARLRAAGVLSLFGDTEAVPLLLGAISSPAVNQSYLPRLAKLAPEALATSVSAHLRARRDEILATTEPRRADYYAKLIYTLDTLGQGPEMADLLRDFQQHGRDWRVQHAASAALAKK